MTEITREEKEILAVAIERWEQALRVLDTVPEDHFHMGQWGICIEGSTDCSTVGCVAGHCSLDPWFRERGLVGTWRPIRRDPCMVEPPRRELVLEGGAEWFTTIREFFQVSPMRRLLWSENTNRYYEEAERDGTPLNLLVRAKDILEDPNHRSKEAVRSKIMSFVNRMKELVA